MHHELKIRSEYYEAVVKGYKTFEIRRNDRHFEVGDTITLVEFDVEAGDTGRFFVVDVTYVFTDTEFVKEGFVILGIKHHYF